MTQPQIGQWAKRTGQKWHLVDSTAAGDIFTRCGRRMADKAGAPFQLSDVMPLTRMIGQPQLCRLCDVSIEGVPIVQLTGKSADDDPAHDFDGPDPFGMPEDDGTTANEVADE